MTNDKQSIKFEKIVNQQLTDMLQQLLLQIQSILKTELICVAIGGSIANHNFDMSTSDIDCYIVTATKLPKNIIRDIEEMHSQFYENNIGLAKRIEASYIPREDLLKFEPSATRPYFNEGKFHLATYGNNFLIELCMLRECGITIFGSDIKSLMTEISRQDLFKAMKHNLSEYWEPLLNDSSKLSRSDYQVFAILTMARTIYSFETGTLTSKSAAAQWVIDHYPSWKPLIEQAIVWQTGMAFHALDEVKNMIRYVLKKYRD